MNELKTIDYLNKHGLEALVKEFDLKIKDYGDRVVLNYGIKCKPCDKTLIVNRECRQLVVRKNETGYWETLSQSFLRFFNLYENNVNDFSFDYAEEKVDGSIISLYQYPKDYFCWATRSTAFAEAETPNNKSFKGLCEKASESIGLFKKDSQGRKAPIYELWNRYDAMTFVFELTGPENRVVKSYKDCSLTLIGGRNEKLREFRRHELDYIADHINVKRPRVIEEIRNIKDVLRYVETLSAEEEGLVLVKTCGEGYFNHARLKVKNKLYLELAYMRNGGVLTNRRIIDLVRKDNVEEYISYFPEDERIISPILDALNRLVKDLYLIWGNVKNIEDQKEFALTIQKYTPFTAPLFAKRKDKNLGIKTFVLSLSTDNVLKQIGIKND